LVKTHRTAAVIIPPRAVWDPIQAIRRQHDRQFRRWMPHITLLYPFRPRSEFEKLSLEFAKVCADLEPFEVELADFDSFKHSKGSRTIWLAPLPQEPLIRLHHALARVVPECNDTALFPGGFKPHLSVGQTRGIRSEFLIKSLRRDWRPLRFSVPAIHLIWRGEKPDDIFRVGMSVPLGPGHAHRGAPVIGD